MERAQNRARILARGVEQEGLLARDPRGHVGGSASKRRRRLVEQSGAGLARERARRGSGAREAAERCAGGGAEDARERRRRSVRAKARVWRQFREEEERSVRLIQGARGKVK